MMDFEALERELAAARAPAVCNPASHLAVRALADVLRRQLKPGGSALEDLAPILAAVERGERLPEIEVVALLVEAEDLIESYRSRRTRDNSSLEVLARRSRIRLVHG
jgi:hypothetical protein